MARKSTKENKNIYQRTRERMELPREEASELLVTMSPERIEKIESERSMPHPDEVLLMSDAYKQPNLCNYYCANQCPIGQQYVPEVKIKDLSQIVLGCCKDRRQHSDGNCNAGADSLSGVCRRHRPDCAPGADRHCC